MAGWDDVVAIGERLPGVEVATSYGTPALRVGSRGMICRLRTDPDALVLRVLDVEDAQALVRGRPDAFFSTPHYDGYPYVLVHLEAVERDELAELLEDAWRIRAPKRAIAAFDAERG